MCTGWRQNAKMFLTSVANWWTIVRVRRLTLFSCTYGIQIIMCNMHVCVYYTQGIEVCRLQIYSGPTLVPVPLMLHLPIEALNADWVNYCGVSPPAPLFGFLPSCSKKPPWWMISKSSYPSIMSFNVGYWLITNKTETQNKNMHE